VEPDEIHLIPEPNDRPGKDDWGYQVGSGAAAINTVLRASDQPLTEDEIVARVRELGLTERGAVANHLLSLRHRGLVTKLSSGFLRIDKRSANEGWLRADEAEESPPPDLQAYLPQNIDRRPILQRQIKARRGQSRFRESLRRRYGDQCAVTGCRVLEILEAAHINPYRSDNDNHEENGLLLRADIHTLFDLDLLGIEPSELKIELHPSIATKVPELAGKRLTCDPQRRPSQEALEIRYRRFCERRDGEVDTSVVSPDAD
jgi:hypothetical protein